MNKFTNGLVNYWPFSGSCRDIIGGMDISIQKNGFLAADRFDNPDSALMFKSGYGSVPAGSYFDPLKGFSAMVWIKILAIDTSQSLNYKICILCLLVLFY